MPPCPIRGMWGGRMTFCVAVPTKTTLNLISQVCEVVTTSIEKGNRDYLDWIGKTVPEKSDA